MKPKNNYEHLWVATRSIRAAGSELNQRFGATEAFEYKDNGELVTQADREIEKLIVEMIQQSFPDHQFICEEGFANFVSKPRWIIDPLDGTMNFFNGVPHYSVSIAFEGSRRCDLGLVYYAPRNDLYVAIEDGGAYRNGTKLTLSGPSTLQDALLVTGFDPASLAELDYDRFEALVESTQGIRRVGSAAAELALVADGVFDVFFERGLGVWDAAAGTLLIEEAGGTVTQIEAIDGINGEMILASDPEIHQDLLTVISNSDH